MELPATSLRLPASLPYPLTIQRIHARQGQSVRKTQRLLTYSFLPSKPDEHGRRERQVREWESPVQGNVVSWDAREGDIIREPRSLVKIQEPCTHDVQLNGLCAICGKDLTATDYTGFSDTSRATISMVHDVGGLTVSLEEAHRLESATASRLLQAKKLSLIVDLDQTIVHATVDPTVGEWLQDPKNPNYKALEGVQKFKLLDEIPMRRPKRARTSTGTTTPGLSESGLTEDGESVADDDDLPGCWYYIKMRPGLPEFLKRIAEIYEMHVYTMGTRAYAIEVCKVIDPDGGLFGGRILSRDESGSMTRKSLQRLFPCDTNMVVIIDDRADVWDGSPNLVKVIPYEFFVGIGDINAAFLPKKKELVPPPTAAQLASPPLAETTPESEGSASPLEVALSGGAEGSSGGSSSPLSSGSESPDPRSTTPTTSPPPGSPLSGVFSPIPTSNAAEAAVHHLHLPDEILSEPTRISDLVVSSSPEEVVSPSMAEAALHAKETIHDLIEARPLEKARREADALHHLQHPPSPKSPSRSPLLSPAAGLSSPSPVPGIGVGSDVSVVGEGESTPATSVEESPALDAASEAEEDYEEEPVLKDDDRELDRLYEILSNVRSQFYEEHASRGVSDVADIIPAMKSRALRDTHLVFSGLVALGTRPEDSEYWKLATTFGARCSSELSSSVTHLVANQAGTAKVHSARRNTRVKVVYPQWLLDSVARWVRLDEEPYLLPLPEDYLSTPGSPIRPELSDGEGEAEGEVEAPEAAEDEEELDLADLDWGDAMKEVDDLLLETDDDDDSASLRNGAGGEDTTDGESDSGSSVRSAAAAAAGGRKRPRVSSGTLSDSDSAAPAGPAESPLQKRVKTARSRRSGLKTSVSAVEGEVPARGGSSTPTARPVESRTESSDSVPAPATSASANGSAPVAAKAAIPELATAEENGAEGSQASSSFGSDDEDLLAMAADLESGWT
ncbi:hypothetical protein JCM8202_003430 [Rhodotorula sphaerocarpa]